MSVRMPLQLQQSESRPNTALIGRISLYMCVSGGAVTASTMRRDNNNWMQRAEYGQRLARRGQRAGH